MSTVPSASTTHSNFVYIFNAALETYKRRTKNDLVAHPLLPSLQSCDSPEAILIVLQEQIPAFNKSKNGDNATKWVTPTVNVLYSFSAAIGGGFGLVNIRSFPGKNFSSNIAFQAFPPANIIFAGIGVLLLVGGLHGSLMQPILTFMAPRRLKMPVLPQTSSLNYLTALNVSLAGLRFTLALHQLRL